MAKQESKNARGSWKRRDGMLGASRRRLHDRRGSVGPAKVFERRPPPPGMDDLTPNLTPPPAPADGYRPPETISTFTASTQSTVVESSGFEAERVLPSYRGRC